MIRIQEQSRLHNGFVAILLRRGVLLTTGGVVTKPQVQLPLRDPVRVEVGGQGRDVSNIGVVHQGLEGDGSSVKEVENL